jgi:4-amino-4-deoxy-L-arabinose transferase-like glycosyltransferase
MDLPFFSSCNNSRIFFLLIGLFCLLRILSIGAHDLLVEEAYYWNYAEHLDFSYLDHPPMVALLIKLSTTLFGTHELGVRFLSLICALFTAYFSFQLSNLISPGSGRFSVFLLAILPFFFLHSLIITPDAPLILCWSAALYNLYQALVQNISKHWITAGVWIGLGMLSKYTIALLGPAIFCYLCFMPKARFWFTKKEPYLAAFLSLLIFSPVIYWNVTHDWISFQFQTSNRLKAPFAFSLHELLGLTILFLTPLGLWSALPLMQKKAQAKSGLQLESMRFLQIFTMVPLSIFALFSICHDIKFNWIGPCLLATIPWLAFHIQQNTKLLIYWQRTAFILLPIYSILLICISFGVPAFLHTLVLTKFIAWEDLTQQFTKVAQQIEQENNIAPIFIPIDRYNLAAELSFYQAKLKKLKTIQKTYPIIGSHIFGGNSLMFKYWSDGRSIANSPLILISFDQYQFSDMLGQDERVTNAPLKKIWAHSQGYGAKVVHAYYKVINNPPAKING